MIEFGDHELMLMEIVQSGLAIIIVLVTSFMWVTGKPVSEEQSVMAGLILGYFFERAGVVRTARLNGVKGRINGTSGQESGT